MRPYAGNGGGAWEKIPDTDGHQNTWPTGIRTPGCDQIPPGFSKVWTREADLYLTLSTVTEGAFQFSMAFVIFRYGSVPW